MTLPLSTRQQLVLAEQYFRAGQHRQAELILGQLALVDGKNSRVHELLGYACGNDGRLDECEAHLLAASRLPQCSAEAFFYLGKVQLQRGRARAAISSIQRSVQQAGEYFEGLHELGVAHSSLGDHRRAIEFFSRAERKKPDSYELHYNLASCLRELHAFDEALVRYDSALALNPGFSRALSGRASVLLELGRAQEALENLDRALALDPENATTWTDRARCLEALKREDEAAASLVQLSRLAPSQDYARGYRLLENMHACRWSGWNMLVSDTVARADAGEKAAPPYTLLATPASAATQLACARTYARDHYPPRSLAVQPRRTARAKLRIGYFSPDFYDHATAQLTVGMLEHHDRERFEWFGFSIGPTAADAVTQRVVKAFDHFVNVEHESDSGIAEMARNLELDIAVDLNGFNEGARTNIFACRAAPIQVNYLGYPGTMGCDYMDYIVADSHLIGPDDYRHYAEKVILIPGSYQPNDDKKQIAALVPGRAAMGLPEDGIVFANFNSIFKITPDLFDVWMRILAKTPRSVLWLLEGSEGSSAALRSEAARRGISPDRLVWAKRLPLPQHLARHACADLFLDTFHYNAHTTCSDALWAGLPVLTCRGDTFASRVASSLLRTSDLSELVVDSVPAYESAAVTLAESPERLIQFRERLARGKAHAPLFDTSRSARCMEAAYEAAWARHTKGMRPDHIHVRV